MIVDKPRISDVWDQCHSIAFFLCNCFDIYHSGLAWSVIFFVTVYIVKIPTLLRIFYQILISLFNSKEEEEGRVNNSENPQLHEVVTVKEGFPYKWDGKAWIPASRSEVQSSQTQWSIQDTHTSGGYIWEGTVHTVSFDWFLSGL